MIAVHAYYIKFHRERICCHHQLVYNPLNNKKSQCQCRRFNELELLLNIVSLLEVDTIGLLGKAHLSFFLAFSICSLVAHSKLCACLFTKLCGRGEEEESCCNCESVSKQFHGQGCEGHCWFNWIRSLSILSRSSHCADCVHKRKLSSSSRRLRVGCQLLSQKH